MTRRRVLIVSGEYLPHPGGIAGYTQLLRGALLRDVDMLVMSAPDTEADMTVRHWNWGTISSVRAAIREHAIDLVHIQYQAGAFQMHPAMNALPRLIGDVPVVTTFHDLRPPYLFPKAGGVRFLVMRRMARWSAAAVVTNPADERLLRASGINPVRIPLGPSLPSPDVMVSPSREVGFFGFPSRQKGFDILIEALSCIDENTRPALTIVGGKPPESGRHGFHSEDHVTALARTHDVRVQWTGYLEPQAASNALASFAVLAFPFPLGATQRSSALIAALRSGRPVVTTETAQDGDLGSLADLPQLITVPAAEPGSIATAIEEAMQHPPSPAPLPPDYEWDSIALLHVDLYRDLLEETNA